MKTLLLIILLQVSQLFPINPNDYILQSADKFENYCIENSIKFDKGELNDKDFFRAYFDDITIICIYTNNETEALKLYYPKEAYSIEKLEKMMKEKLYTVEGQKKIFIAMENPKILYHLSESEDERFNSITVYIHGPH